MAFDDTPIYIDTLTQTSESGEILVSNSTQTESPEEQLIFKHVVVANILSETLDNEMKEKKNTISNTIITSVYQ